MRRRSLAVLLVGVTLALSVVVVRLLIDARAAFRKGAAAEQNGEVVQAVRHYLEAGRLYLPGSPYTRAAFDRLEAIGIAAINKGDYATARMAFEAERAAMLGTRSFYTPYANRLPDIERRLSRLLAAIETDAAAGSFEEKAQWHAEQLGRRSQPKSSLVLLALLGLGLWVTSAVIFFNKGVDKNLTLKRLPAILSSTGFFIGFGLFLICLRLA
jgi:hypothetical protein